MLSHPATIPANARHPRMRHGQRCHSCCHCINFKSMPRLQPQHHAVMVVPHYGASPPESGDMLVGAYAFSASRLLVIRRKTSLLKVGAAVRAHYRHA